MGVLEQVTQMRNQGIAEDEIVNRLQEQGIAPKAINDALNQSKIKEAVGHEKPNEMEPSIIEGQTETSQKTLQPPAPYPKTEEIENYQEEEFYTPQPQQEQQQWGGQQSYPYAQEFYPQEGYGEYYPETNTDMMIEIAGQVFSEKIRKMQKQLEELNDFKTLAETKIEFLSKRLERIETLTDKLQSAILERIGSYGRGIENIKKEMNMMQDSFTKMIPELAKKHISHPHKKTTSKNSKKKTASKKKE